MTDQERDGLGEVPITRLPIEVEAGVDRFRISPLAVIDHVKEEPSRELEKTILEDSIEYRVYSGVEYDDEDSSQKTWEAEYGLECFENGRVRTFVDYDPVYSTRESAQLTMTDDIFDKLERRTLRYYAKNGLEEAAEILRG